MAACAKCKSGVAFAASRQGPREPRCAECFEGDFEREVHDAFFRKCAVPPDTRLAIAVSGGSSSMSMLDFLARLRAQSLARGGAGRIHFDFVVVHVSEEGVVVGDQPSFFANIRQMIARHARKVGFEEERIHTSTSFFDGMSEPERARLVEFLNGRAALSEREDAYLLARRASIMRACAKLGCSGILLGDCGERAAIAALTCIVRARGADVVSEAGARGIWGGMAVMRPLRNVLAKEVCLYSRSRGIPQSYTPAPGFGTSLRSLNRTIEDFVLGLQVGFRSTIFSILQCVAKLRPPFDDTDHQAATAASKKGRVPPLTIPHGGYPRGSTPHCALCGSRLDGPAPGAEAAPPPPQDGSLVEETAPSAAPSPRCHGCSMLLEGIMQVRQTEASAVTLAVIARLQREADISMDPPVVLRRASDAEMRAEIGEFLVAEEDD